MTTVDTYFEDVTIGDEDVSPRLTLTEAHVGLYRGVASEAGDAGVVPELLPLCLSTGLGWRMARPPLVVLAFMGFEWRIHRPLSVGDTIHSRSRIAVKRSMREGGVIVEEHVVVDQRGEVVQSGRFTFLVAKRAGVPVAERANT